MLESMRDYLITTIQKTFEVGFDQAEKLYQELLQCTRSKNLVSKYLKRLASSGTIFGYESFFLAF